MHLKIRKYSFHIKKEKTTIKITITYNLYSRVLGNRNNHTIVHNIIYILVLSQFTK